MNEFEKYLQDSLGPHKPEKIDELVLDDFFTDFKEFNPVQKEGLEVYTNLIHLSLKHIGLKSLKNLPEIKGLMILTLSENELTGDDLETIASNYPFLNKLKLSNNAIRDINVFKKLAKTKIRKIEIKENPFIKEEPNFREKIYKMIPSLTIINQMDKNEQEIDTTNYNEDSEDEEEEDDDEKDYQYEDSEDSNEDFEEAKGKFKGRNNSASGENDSESEEIDEEEEEEESKNKKKHKKK